VGNSLRIQSPNDFKRIDSGSCRLEGWGEALRLEKVKQFSPPDVSISLDGAVSWTLTAPPSLKVVKGFEQEGSVQRGFALQIESETSPAEPLHWMS
jgi:hypothetical protein